MVADYIGCMIQLPLGTAGAREWGETIMTSERYAAGDDAFKAVIEHAPNKESTNLSGLVANAGVRRSEAVTASGRLPEVAACAASSLKPDIDTRKPTVAERTQDGETAWSGRTARRMRDPQNPAPRGNATLT